MTWVDDSATAPDGVTYVLHSETVRGELPMWRVFVYEVPGQGATRELAPEKGWPTKAKARTLAQRDATVRATVDRGAP